MRLRGFVACGLLALAACSGDAGGPKPGPAELNLVMARIGDQLNDPAVRLQRQLAYANRDKRIHPTEVTVTGGERVLPADWWIYDRGLLEFAGVDESLQGYFLLTPKGQAFIDGPEPRWLQATFQAPPKLNCAGGGAWASCQVEGVAVIGATPEAADLRIPPPSIPPRGFVAELHYGPNGWQVADLGLAPGTELAQAARVAVFGDADHITKARYRFALDMNRRVR